MRTAAQSFLRHPLSAVFANPANVRVLRELSRHGGELSATMLVERTRLSKPSVLAALAHLSGLGYIESLGSHRQRLHRIDSKHPLASSISSLFLTEDHRFQAIIEAIRKAATEAGAAAAWLYGSVARAEDRPDSDVDVALVSTRNAGAAKGKMRDALREVEGALRFSTSVVSVDTDDIRRLVRERDPWWVAMVKDAMPLVGPDPVSLAARPEPKKKAV